MFFKFGILSGGGILRRNLEMTVKDFKITVLLVHRDENIPRAPPRTHAHVEIKQ